MCNPINSDLLFGSDDRVLSGVCLWRGMRTGGNVFHLYGRVPSSGAGCRSARSASEATAGSNSATILGESLIPNGIGASKELNQFSGVQEKKRVHAVPMDDCQMMVGMPNSVLSRRLCTPQSRGLRSVSKLEVSPERVQTSNLYVAASRAFQTRGTHHHPVARPVAEADSLPGRRISRPQVSSRQLQNSAAAGQISTGGNHMNTQGKRNQTSAIVLVTTPGNVMAFLQLLPRG